MREKLYNICKQLYAAAMYIAFFGGVLPLIPFIIAIIVGGTTGEAISVFLIDKYYPWVIALASIAVLIGLVGMYISKQQALSAKSFKTKKDKKEEENEADK